MPCRCACIRRKAASASSPPRRRRRSSSSTCWRMRAATSLLDAPLSERRAALEAFHAKRRRARRPAAVALHARRRARRGAGSTSPAARSTASSRSGSTSRYEPGERAMLKVKRLRTADCVVGGFRYASNSRQVGSLLLGLYDDAGKLDHVGFTSAIAQHERAGADAPLEALVGAARLHRQGAGRPEPLEHRALGRVAAAAARARRRSALRSGDRRPLPPRHDAAALAPRQGAAAMPLRPARARGADRRH